MRRGCAGGRLARMSMRALTSLLLLAIAAAGLAQEAPAEDPALAELRAQSARLTPLVSSELAREFLQATAGLPAVTPRRVLAAADRSRWFTPEQAEALPADERAALTERTLDSAFYWNTRYGTPLAYARALDLAAAHGLSAEGAAIVDFGCGGLGAARLLAGCGASVTGVDVDPLLPAFYSRPGDQGEVLRGEGRAPGRVALVMGRWPAENAAVVAVDAAAPQGLDLFLSKNTLKHGYVHPAQEVDPRMLVRLGVDDAAFVEAVAGRLRPGGLFLIYNLCPAPAPEGQPYIPWADGRCPFARDLLERAGLEVLAFDQVDDAAARASGVALGWDQGDGAMDLQNDLFAWFTLARRPADRSK